VKFLFHWISHQNLIRGLVFGGNSSEIIFSLRISKTLPLGKGLAQNHYCNQSTTFEFYYLVFANVTKSDQKN